MNEGREPSGETLEIESRRFGRLEVPAASVFRFPAGLVGFPDFRRFVLLDNRPGSAFKFMLSVDDPELAFAVVHPGDLVDGWVAPLEAAGRALGTETDDVAIFALVTIPQDPNEMTINLLAPLAVDLKSREGCQVVLDEPGLSPAHRVIPAAPDPASSDA